jgi:DNA-binding Lrp family transcriptional regulator
MDEIDRAIVNALQGGFPLTPRPFADAARPLGLDERTLMARVRAMLAEGTLTRFGPLYQIERMGGRFLLAAMQVPASDFERVASIVNALPEVAHNYQREHALNMWFVVAAESAAAVERAVTAIETASGYPVHRFPKEREYFVEMVLAA